MAKMRELFEKNYSRLDSSCVYKEIVKNLSK